MKLVVGHFNLRMNKHTQHSGVKDLQGNHYLVPYADGFDI